MNHQIKSFVLAVIFGILCSCEKKAEYSIDVKEVHLWCILEFDSLDRSPEARIAMLREMGFSNYGYNWRERHLEEMKTEFSLAKENDIQITSIFLWLNAKRDSLGKLSPQNQQMLKNLMQVDYKPTIWLSFSNNFFETLDQKQSIDFCVEMIKYVKRETDMIGCKLALYNHHGWFGNPHNQVEILEKLQDESLTMVYNFHHAHEYLDEFPQIAKKIKPYLSHVNLNGMTKDGSKILTFGEGDFEFEMTKILMDEGYNGPWGILGHIKSEDVQIVLERNVRGLHLLNSQFKEIEKD